MFSFSAIWDSTPVIEGDGLIIRCPQQRDFYEWRALRLESRKFLTPFEPTWGGLELNSRHFSTKVKRSRRDAQEGIEYSFLIFQGGYGHQTLVGGMTLSNIRRRAAQNVTLGYWMGEKYAGKGIMTRAVALILPFVFDTLNLHRIEAACLPDNEPSRRVLTHNGFQEIGIAESYLQINGEWRDHVLFGLARERYESFCG